MAPVKTARFWIMTLGFCLVTLPAISFSQESTTPEEAEMTEKQYRQFIQKQFDKMYARAAKTAAEKLKLGGNLKAFAVVADRGNNIRQVTIDEIEKMPAEVALEVMRRSLTVMVRKGNVGATCLVYTTANPNKDAKAENVLVAEMEHIFGPTQAQITPYTNVAGKTEFGEPVTAELKPSLFNFKVKREEGGGEKEAQ